MNVDEVKEKVKEHKVFIAIICCLYAISIFTVFDKTEGFHIDELKKTFFLFGNAITAVILLWAIGGYLIYRYIVKTPPRKESLYQLILIV